MSKRSRRPTSCCRKLVTRPLMLDVCSRQLTAVGAEQTPTIGITSGGTCSSLLVFFSLSSLLPFPVFRYFSSTLFLSLFARSRPFSRTISLCLLSLSLFSLSQSDDILAFACVPLHLLFLFLSFPRVIKASDNIASYYMLCRAVLKSRMKDAFGKPRLASDAAFGTEAWSWYALKSTNVDVEWARTKLFFEGSSPFLEICKPTLDLSTLGDILEGSCFSVAGFAGLFRPENSHWKVPASAGVRRVVAVIGTFNCS